MGENHYYGKNTRQQAREAVYYVLVYRPLIRYWTKKLGLTHLTVKTEPISRDQVMFPKDISKEDRYFVGVAIEGTTVTITHDRDLTEEDILHELLHIANPGKDDKEGEDWINAETTKLIKQKEQ